MSVQVFPNSPSPLPSPGPLGHPLQHLRLRPLLLPLDRVPVADVHHRLPAEEGQGQGGVVLPGDGHHHQEQGGVAQGLVLDFPDIIYFLLFFKKIMLVFLLTWKRGWPPILVTKFLEKRKKNHRFESVERCKQN